MIKRYQRTAIPQYLIVGIILLALMGLGFLSKFMMENLSFMDYFAIPWAAGRAWLLEGQNPYTSDVRPLADEAIRISGFLGILPETSGLIHPMINLLFFLPFSLVPYSISRILWVVLLGLSVFLTANLSLKLVGKWTGWGSKFALLLFSFAWFPAVFSILTGDLNPLVILLIVLSVHFIQIEQDTAAGFLLAAVFGSAPITLIPLLFVIIWSISRKRWSIIVAIFSGLAFLITVTVLMFPSWPMDWLRVVLTEFSNWEGMQTPLSQIAAFLPGIERFLSLALHGIIGLYLLVILITSARRREKEFSWLLCTVLVIAYLFNPTNQLSAIVLLIPAIILVVKVLGERWRLIGKLFSWIVLILIAGVPWILVSPEIYFTENHALPILQIIFPLVILIGLVWVRWWAIKFPHLLYRND